MNAMKQSIWACLALMLLAGSAWYYARTSSPIKSDNDSLSSTPDTLITQLSVQQFDEQGHLTHYLNTPSMRHIPLDNSHQFTTPHIIITKANQPAWEINAKDAIALHGGTQITFNHQVVIHQTKDTRTEESTLKTEELIYFPKTQQATTQKEVTFEQAGSIVESTGMNAFLAENRVQLLSNARGTYASNQG
jgi:lipopolysaccharide export system protein LptC